MLAPGLKLVVGEGGCCVKQSSATDHTQTKTSVLHLDASYSVWFTFISFLQRVGMPNGMELCERFTASSLSPL